MKFTKAQAKTMIKEQIQETPDINIRESYTMYLTLIGKQARVLSFEQDFQDWLREIGVK